MSLCLQLFIQASCSCLSLIVQYIQGIKYSDIKLSNQGKLFVFASDIQQFKVLCRSAYCSAWNFCTKNWQELNLRYQSIQVSCFLASFLSFFLSFCDLFSDRKLYSEAAYTTINYFYINKKYPFIR